MCVGDVKPLKYVVLAVQLRSLKQPLCVCVSVCVVAYFHHPPGWNEPLCTSLHFLSNFSQFTRVTLKQHIAGVASQLLQSGVKSGGGLSPADPADLGSGTAGCSVLWRYLKRV